MTNKCENCKYYNNNYYILVCNPAFHQSLNEYIPACIHDEVFKDLFEPKEEAKQSINLSPLDKAEGMTWQLSNPKDFAKYPSDAIDLTALASKYPVPTSECCNAIATVIGSQDFIECGDDVCTMHYECSKYGEACDVA